LIFELGRVRGWLCGCSEQESRGQYFEDTHGSGAVGAEQAGDGCGSGGRLGAGDWFGIVAEELLTERQKVGSAPLSEKAVETDTNEPTRQDVEQKAPQELL